MNRELTSHKVDGRDELLKIEAVDVTERDGIPCEYVVSYSSPPFRSGHMVRFQNGPIAEFGINGLTHEALLAILVDHLEAVQSGPCADDENKEALFALQRAQRAFKRRTIRRLSRGVEGPHDI